MDNKVVALPGCSTPNDKQNDLDEVLGRLVEITAMPLDSLAVVYVTKDRQMKAIHAGCYSDLIASIAKAQHKLMEEFCAPQD